MTRLALTALIACMVLAAAARSQQMVVFPAHNPESSLYADIDGDGIPDLIDATWKLASPTFPWVLSYGQAIRRGVGNGTFGEEQFVEGPMGPLVDAADVTGDGIVDLVTLDSGPVDDGARFTVVPILGDGSFAPIVQSPTSVILESWILYFHRHALGDVDGDGIPDYILAASSPAGTYDLSVARSTGDGHFEGVFALPVDLPMMSAGDYDGDGLIDAAMLDYANRVNVYTATGQGGFSTVPLVSSVVAGGSSQLSSIASADVDQDGHRDVIVVLPQFTTSAGALAVLHGDGSGLFHTATLTPTQGRAEPCLADFDGNGWTDVALVPNSYASAATLETCLNDGAGNLLPPVVSATFPVVSPWIDPPQALDLDGDGLPDLALPQILAGRGDGTFVDRIQLSTNEEKPWLVAAADMNADGAPDIVGTLSAASDPVAVLLGEGDGTFGEMHRPSIPDYAFDLALGDLDGDGLPDLVLDQGLSTGPLTASLNEGGGTDFAAPFTLASFDVSDIVLADIDSTGSLDVLITRVNPMSNSIWIVRGDGSGHFDPPTEVNVGGKGLGLSVGDLDGDGTLDLVATINLAKELRFALGLGAGTFGAAEVLTLAAKPNHVEVSDLDGNGLADLATSNTGPSSVTVLLATASAQFGPAQDIPMQQQVEDIAAADLDRDGDADLVTPEVEILLGHGDGTFAEPMVHATGDGKLNLALADFDADGFTDVAVADREPGMFSVLINRLTTFPNLGYQHDGGFGFPYLTGTGTPAPGELVSLTATGVPATALGFLILGLQFAPEPFAGGTLVPSPDVAVPMHPDVPLTGRWPELPEGVQLYMQAWFTTGGQVAGSNAVVGISP